MFINSQLLPYTQVVWRHSKIPEFMQVVITHFVAKYGLVALLSSWRKGEEKDRCWEPFQPDTCILLTQTRHLSVLCQSKPPNTRLGEKANLLLMTTSQSNEVQCCGLLSSTLLSTQLEFHKASPNYCAVCVDPSIVTCKLFLP